MIEADFVETSQIFLDLFPGKIYNIGARSARRNMRL